MFLPCWTGEHPFHHVALSRRQTREVTRCCRSPFYQLFGVMRQFESALNTCEEFLTADPLFDEIQCAQHSWRTRTNAA
jgi:hypothetical protein